MSTFDKRAFGRKLRAAREEAELSQIALADRSVSGDGDGQRPISEAYVSTLERGAGGGRPSDGILLAIARGLHITDPWVVREWAGVERTPNWARALQAINADPALPEPLKKLLADIYMVFVGRA